MKQVDRLREELEKLKKKKYLKRFEYGGNNRKLRSLDSFYQEVLRGRHPHVGDTWKDLMRSVINHRIRLENDARRRFSFHPNFKKNKIAYR